jgi:hypothetical protein
MAMYEEEIAEKMEAIEKLKDLKREADKPEKSECSDAIKDIEKSLEAIEVMINIIKKQLKSF